MLTSLVILLSEDPEGDDSDSDSILSDIEEEDDRSGSDYNSDDDASNDANSLKDDPKTQKSWVSSVRALFGLGRSDAKGKGRAYQPVQQPSGADGVMRG